MKEFYLCSGWDEMLSSYITTPVKLIYDDGMINKMINGNLELEYEVEFYSGFYNPYLSDSDEICMNIGYIIREDQKIKKDKIKEFYTNEGVNNNKSQLQIPRRLQNKIHEILDIFNVNFYSYYGIDPEEEARKQYYIDLGVKKEEADEGIGNKYMVNKIFVPESLKNDLIKINEIKKLFNVYRIKFY